MTIEAVVFDSLDESLAEQAAKATCLVKSARLGESNNLLRPPQQTYEHLTKNNRDSEMGFLINGKWSPTWYDTDTTKGEFKRLESVFRNWIGSPPMVLPAFQVKAVLKPNPDAIISMFLLPVLGRIVR
ncbi:hypothetical protein [Hydrogenovibrio sp. JE_KL2]|uniref:hypothetical protein n=1 Tax=Hydrogenovibrio sp. JE_KL2 TaxID=2651188 RepID=UPI002738F037|nr:hypothetical protein [Hydrogenovibrio sp. JE_KL2]